MEVSSGTGGERRYRSCVLDRHSPAALSRLGLAVLLSLAFLPGCGQSPVAPGGAAPMLTGYVYEVMLPERESRHRRRGDHGHGRRRRDIFGED